MPYNLLCKAVKQIVYSFIRPSRVEYLYARLQATVVLTMHFVLDDAPVAAHALTDFWRREICRPHDLVGRPFTTIP